MSGFASSGDAAAREIPGPAAAAERFRSSSAASGRHADLNATIGCLLRGHRRRERGCRKETHTRDGHQRVAHGYFFVSSS